MPKNRSGQGRSRPAWTACVLLSAFVVAACTTGEKMAQIHDGMSKDQVVATLGAPDGYSRDGNTEVLSYADRLISGWGFDRADYQVRLSGGQVIAYGPEPMRHDRPMDR
jgi:hypothetical protein